MTTTIETSSQAIAETRMTQRIKPTWLAAWALITALTTFHVVSAGTVDGSMEQATALGAVAVGFFIAPDLTFLIGIGEPVESGRLPRRVVPWYNAMHRLRTPLALTAVVLTGSIVTGTDPGLFLVAGLSWIAHIALDRAAGYTLRNPDGSVG